MTGTTTNRRGFFRLAGAAGAGIGMLGTTAGRAAILAQTAEPVWAFHPDYLYVDRMGAEPYRPPLGARGAAPLAELSAEEIARAQYQI